MFAIVARRVSHLLIIASIWLFSSSDACNISISIVFTASNVCLFADVTLSSAISLMTSARLLIGFMVTVTIVSFRALSTAFII